MASYCTGYYYRKEFFDCDMDILPHASFSSDLEWWAMLLSDWNRMSMMASLGRVLPDVTLTSNASRKLGCGAFSSMRKWFQELWDCSQANVVV